ncbi:MAG: flagellar biosynthesis regulator FlaF [Rhizobiaceae bacterium]|nr:flagellar biosynthesis regulator FlaF [Rhizobiaceae bacterium]
MFNQAYTESMEDGQETARSQEREVLGSSIRLMREADASPDHHGKRVEAIYFTTRLWSHFLNDLVSADNVNSDEMKAGLISIGIFIMRHIEKMRQDKTQKFGPVVDVSKTIYDGLGNG